MDPDLWKEMKRIQKEREDALQRFRLHFRRELARLPEGVSWEQSVMWLHGQGPQQFFGEACPFPQQLLDKELWEAVTDLHQSID